jgi:hypothetical protein
MTTRSQVNLEWGTAAEIASVTLTDRELVVDVTNRRLVLMDGVTLGGKPVAMIADVTAAIGALTSGVAANFNQWLYCS